MIGFSLGFVLVWTLPKYNHVIEQDYDGNIVFDERGEWTDDQYKWLIAMAVFSAAVCVSMWLLCKPVGGWVGL